MFSPMVRHRCWKVGVEPVKWMPARSGWASATSETSRPSPGSMLMTPGGIPASSSSSMRQRRGELLGRRRLPDDRVAHQRRRGGQVAGDRGEVERRDRVDEALERAVVGAVPDARAVRDRLVGEDLLGVVDVEAPEVDQLAGAVDLGLERRLRLAEHGGGVDPLPPRAGQQVGRLEQDGAPVVEVSARQPGAASPAALIAARASAWVAFLNRPSTCWWSCGCTTVISAPPPALRRPPMWALRSCCVARASRARRAGPPVRGCRARRSGSAR